MAEPLKIPYVVYTLPYCHYTGGIRALHRLVHLLNEEEYEAYTTFPSNPEWNERFTPIDNRELIDRSIVVYPEVIQGNPLNAQKRVRWMLNKPGFFGGQTSYDKEELLFTWSKDYYDLPNDRVLTTVFVEEDLFNKNFTEPKSIDCFYVGKGWKKERSPVTNGMLEITVSFPLERKELSELLKKTRTFYTYDFNTQLNLEASLCGCQVILLPENTVMEGMKEQYNEQIKIKEEQLNNFINITQKNWI